MKVKIKYFLTTVAIIMMMTTVVFAATKTRQTTYAMSAGVNSKSMAIKKNGKLSVKMEPNVAKSHDCPITLYVDEKHWFGWGGSGIGSKSVNSLKRKTVTFTVKSKGTYRVYLSSPHREYVEGTVTFTWDAQ